MRSCPTFSVCSHLAHYSRRGVGHDLAKLAATRRSSVHSRLYATAAVAHESPSTPSVLKSPFASSSTQPPYKLGHASTLTALHKARELITRILPPQSPELSFWNDILRDVSDETCRCSLTSNEEKITIVGMFVRRMLVGLMLTRHSVLYRRVLRRRGARKCPTSRPFLAGGGERTDHGALGRS